MTQNRHATWAFDKLNAFRLQSATLEKLWRDAYGSDYAAQARPNAFYPVQVLSELEHVFRKADHEALVDLGCGHGLAGLQLADRVGMELTGIDSSAESVALAQQCAIDLGLRNQANFAVGDAIHTGLPDDCCDAVISLDVLLYVQDKMAAFTEIARILRPGGHLGFTTWEQDGHSERLNAAQLADHRPLLAACGFEVEIYEEPRDWQVRQRSLLESMVASEGDLRHEIGSEATNFMTNMARGAMQELPMRRYVFVVARLGGSQTLR